MKSIKIKAPAKINLTLEVLNKRADGYHNIQSIMQAVSLYDFLTAELNMHSGGRRNKITLSGSSSEIPYDERNLAYKAAKLFFDKTGIKNAELSVYIEKNIPVSAGLAGGSADAAGMLYMLNELYNNILNDAEMNELCAVLGSDINFCLRGGCSLCTSRGEIIAPLPVYRQSYSLIKPKNLAISAKEAYEKFAASIDKSILDNTSKLKNLMIKGKFDKAFLCNSLEKALLPYYTELNKIKSCVKDAVMTGSGSAFFIPGGKIEYTDASCFNSSDYLIFENLSALENGITEIDI